MNYLFSVIFVLFLSAFFANCQSNADLPIAVEMPTSCTDYELITVDFEPLENMVQTIPYHLEKEPMNYAFVSVKMTTHQMPWKIWFSSEFVTFKSDYPVTFGFDDYTGNTGWEVTQEGGRSIIAFDIWDTLQMSQYLQDYEQIIAELEIECYNP
jgi:hypothetical protein